MAYNVLNGAIKNTSIPCFFAYLSATASDVTGDGTVYTIIFDTEVIDQASNYNNATGVFTAPVTGNYLFTANVPQSNVTGFSVTARFAGSAYSTYFVQDTGGASDVLICASSIMLRMTSGDTMSVQSTVFGGAKIVDILGGTLTNGHVASFSAYFVC